MDQSNLLSDTEGAAPQQRGVSPRWRQAALGFLGAACVASATAAIVVSAPHGHASSNSPTTPTTPSMPALDTLPHLSLPQSFRIAFSAEDADSDSGASAIEGTATFSAGALQALAYSDGEVAHEIASGFHRRVSAGGAVCDAFGYHVPPLSQLLSAVRKVPAGSSSSSAAAQFLGSSAVPCRHGEDAYAASLDRSVYKVCVRARDNVPTSVSGADFSAAITSFEEIAEVAGGSRAPAGCEASSLASAAVAHFAEHAPGADLAAVWDEAHRRHEAREMAPMASKHCVFLHGAGESPAGPDTTTGGAYWGKKLNKKLKQCLSFTYVHKETRNNMWDNKGLMQSYCDAATAFSSNSVAQNVIIFTHSMGNNIFAGALGSGLCSLGSTATWYSVSGPVAGSEVCDMIQAICDDTHPSEVLKAVVSQLSYCASKPPSQPNPAYFSLKTSYNFAIAKAGFKKADGVMCGDSPMGLNSYMSLGLAALAGIVKFGKPNDGMVTVDSCSLGAGSSYPRTWTSRFYTGSLNHGDTTGINGDGWYGEARMPLSWYASRG